MSASGDRKESKDNPADFLESFLKVQQIDPEELKKSFLKACNEGILVKLIDYFSSCQKRMDNETALVEVQNRYTLLKAWEEELLTRSSELRLEEARLLSFVYSFLEKYSPPAERETYQQKYLESIQRFAKDKPQLNPESKKQKKPLDLNDPHNLVRASLTAGRARLFFQRDTKNAAKYAILAVRKGDPSRLHYLGELFYEGDGVPLNHEIAAACCRYYVEYSDYLQIPDLKSSLSHALLKASHLLFEVYCNNPANFQIIYHFVILILLNRMEFLGKDKDRGEYESFSEVVDPYFPALEKNINDFANNYPTLFNQLLEKESEWVKLKLMSLLKPSIAEKVRINYGVCLVSEILDQPPLLSQFKPLFVALCSEEADVKAVTEKFQSPQIKTQAKKIAETKALEIAGKQLEETEIKSLKAAEQQLKMVHLDIRCLLDKKTDLGDDLLMEDRLLRWLQIAGCYCEFLVESKKPYPVFGALFQSASSECELKDVTEFQQRMSYVIELCPFKPGDIKPCTLNQMLDWVSSLANKSTCPALLKIQIKELERMQKGESSGLVAEFKAAEKAVVGVQFSSAP